jgi:hypothetical protein
MSRTSKRLRIVVLWAVCGLSLALTSIPYAAGQRTLGGITGNVTDKTGSVLPETTVTIVGDETKLTRTLKTDTNGNYDFVNSADRHLHADLHARRISNTENSFDPGAGRPHRDRERCSACGAGRHGRHG